MILTRIFSITIRILLAFFDTYIDFHKSYLRLREKYLKIVKTIDRIDDIFV